MEMSAFDVLIVPAFWTVIGSRIAGAAVRGLMNVMAAMVESVVRRDRFLETMPRMRSHTRS
jgi:hypothetical protein